MKKTSRRLLAIGAILAVTAIASPQIAQVIKLLGVGAAIRQFGGDINKGLNDLVKHKDTQIASTKVVPIVTISLNQRRAIGAAQVMGERSLVTKVKAVAQLEQNFFGREIKIRALVPVSDENILAGIKRVEGVGVSGIVDLNL
jgi:hypothetical protein